MSRKNQLLATLFVVAHLAIGVIHMLAHDGLGVGLTRFQDVFVNSVYVGLPVLAAVLVWTRLYRFGAVLLLASIAGSLVFGVWYHFVFVSPDHVAHLPEGGQRLLFQVTAVLMTLVDAGGVWLAAMLLRASWDPRPASAV
jgi:hypothetical protein